MSAGNTLFLVCQPCEKAGAEDFGVKLASRDKLNWYNHEVPPKQLDAWLHNHRNCAGRGHPDHFVLAHKFERDHDQSVTTAVEQAVADKLAKIQQKAS